MTIINVMNTPSNKCINARIPYHITL